MIKANQKAERWPGLRTSGYGLMALAFSAFSGMLLFRACPAWEFKFARSESGEVDCRVVRNLGNRVISDQTFKRVVGLSSASRTDPPHYGRYGAKKGTSTHTLTISTTSGTTSLGGRRHVNRAEEDKHLILLAEAFLTDTSLDTASARIRADSSDWMCLVLTTTGAACSAGITLHRCWRKDLKSAGVG